MKWSWTKLVAGVEVGACSLKKVSILSLLLEALGCEQAVIAVTSPLQ